MIVYKIAWALTNKQLSTKKSKKTISISPDKQNLTHIEQHAGSFLSEIISSFEG